MNHGSNHTWIIQGMPRIASSSTLCNFLLHFSCYSIPLNLIFTAHTFSPTFHNFLSSLPQMEPTPSQVRNHHSQTNQEAHLQRALEFQNAANLHCPTNVCLPIIRHCALCCGWPISPISSLTRDDYPDLEIGDDDSEYPGESTLPSYFIQDDLDHQQVVLPLGQARQDKSFWTTRVPLPKKWSLANTDIGCPPPPNIQNPAVAMAPPLL